MSILRVLMRHLLGTLLLAAGLVTLLLPISKGSTWGWANPTTLALFVPASVKLAVPAA